MTELYTLTTTETVTVSEWVTNQVQKVADFFGMSPGLASGLMGALSLGLVILLAVAIKKRQRNKKRGYYR